MSDSDHHHHHHHHHHHDRRKVKDSLVECLITTETISSEKNCKDDDDRGNYISFIMTRNSGKMSCFESLYAMEKGN